MTKQSSPTNIRKKFDAIAKYIEQNQDVPAFLTRQMENVKTAYTLAETSNAPEIQKLAESHAETFIVAAQMSGIANMTRANKESAKRSARYDVLTGSGNRRNFDEELTAKIENTPEEGPGQYSAVFFFDLDRFKGLNDKYGHATGDTGLKEFAKTLRDLTRDEKTETAERPADQIYIPQPRVDFRFGGDEFAIIMSANADSPEQAEAIFQKIEDRIKEATATLSFQHDDKTFPLLASMGLHVVKQGDTIEAVSAGADAALYEHKKDKTERYEKCHEALLGQDLTNLQYVADKRKSEAEEMRIKIMGTALSSLASGRQIKIIVPEGAEPHATDALENAGVTIEFTADPAEPGELTH